MGYRVGPVGTGTVSGTSGTKNITGVASAFTTQFQTGDTIVFIDTSGNHDAYIVDAVTDATHLTVTTTLGETYAGVAYYGQRDADDLFAMAINGNDPGTVYRAGSDSTILGDGTLLWRGYPTSTWRWGWMTVAQWTALKAYIAGAGYSAACYVETRDDEDDFSRFQSVCRFQDPATLERWRGRYTNVSVEFVLITEVA